MIQTSVQQASTTARGKRTRRTGKVVARSGIQTIRVRHEYRIRHPKYGKYVRRRTTLHAHDEKEEAGVGDIVEVVACRRISKTKCWRLLRVLRRLEG